MKNSNAFRLGRFGAAEAHLFQVVAFGDERVRLLAGSSALEVVAYLAKSEPELRVQTVNHLGLVTLLSGSPHF